MNAWCGIVILGVFLLFVLAIGICAHEARQQALKERDL